MKAKDLQEILEQYPDFDIVISQVEDLPDDYWARKDEPIWGVHVDDDNEEICFFNKENADKFDQN